mgnify:CR=1 FL=1
MKKLALLLAVLMVLTCSVAYAGAAVTEPGTLPIVTEPVTLKADIVAAGVAAVFLRSYIILVQVCYGRKINSMLSAAAFVYIALMRTDAVVGDIA